MFSKIISFLSVCLLCGNDILADAAALQGEKRTFIATAYYSPLPGQSFYLKGSYEADLRLNGNGTHGASGKAVYPGMIAAPKGYDFGTKIVIPGLGTGSVEDRGGAIVKAGERGYAYDRIDIWMGQGENGLKRALGWGKRTVTATVFTGSDSGIQSSIGLPKVPEISIAAYQTTAKTSDEMDVFSEVITQSSGSGKIRNLSKVLISLGYLNSAPVSEFTPDLKIAIIHFQIENKLIRSATDAFAGNYGPLTRKSMKVAYQKYQKDAELAMSDIGDIAKSLSTVTAKAKKDIKDAEKLLLWVDSAKVGESGQHVRVLQEALIKLGYYKEKTTGIFGEKTRDAVAAFQIEHHLVASKNDPNAGKFGKVTKATMLAVAISQGIE